MLEAPQAAPAFLRALAELKYQGQNCLAGHAAPGLSRPEPHCGKGRFNRIRGSNVLPVHGRKIIECHQRVPILEQAVRCLRVLGFVGSNYMENPPAQQKISSKGNPTTDISKILDSLQV